MAVPVFRFPLLVLRIILMQLKPYEIFSLATTSNKSKKYMKSCLSHQRFTILYEANRSVTLYKGISGRIIMSRPELEIRMVEKPKQKLVYPYQVWKLLGQDQMSIRVVKQLNTIIIVSYWEERTDALHRMVQFFVDFLTNPQLRLYFGSGSPDYCRTAIRFVKSFELEVACVCVEPDRWRRRAVHNELMRIAMEECGDVRRLRINCQYTELDLEIGQPLIVNCDCISIESAAWVTKEHLVGLFFKCETVSLWGKNYEDQDLVYIIERWMAGSQIKFLSIRGTTNFYYRKSLANTVGQLPGATPVQKALVQRTDVGHTEVVEFEEGKCYRVEQEGGERDALVFLMDDAVHLAEKYEIGDDVDKMRTTVWEREVPFLDYGQHEEREEEGDERAESDQDDIVSGEYGNDVFELSEDESESENEEIPTD